MSHVLQVFQTVLAFASVVLLCVFLKYRGIIKAEHGHLFAQLLTEVVLPVVIFAKLATHPIAPQADFSSELNWAVDMINYN